MKKLLSLALSASLAASCLPAALAEEAKGYAVGDTESGFTVTRVDPYDLIGADVFTFEHDKTGAQVLFIKNEDNNRLFTIGFHTPAEDDTGTPHVFEHSTLDGSKKYPYATMFFSLSNQTYNTYMNALTSGLGYTYYPHASMSEDQLLATTDFYVDSVFNPTVMEDKSIFEEEAWRYSLASLDADLKYEGTVYSEMTSSYDITRAHSQNEVRSAYPGSLFGNSTGGNPVYIPDMTWESIKDFHDRYYHPSNSVTILYGNIEAPEKFLSLLDGYFSAYDKKEFIFDDPGVTATESGTFRYTFPAAADTDTDGGSLISIVWPLEGATEEQMDVLDLLTTVLASSASPLSEKLRERLPNAEVSTYVNTGSTGYALDLYATNVNPGDETILQEIMKDVFAEIAEKSFDEELIASVAHTEQMNELLATESSTIGLDLAGTVFYYFFLTDTPYHFTERVYTTEKFESYNAGPFADTVKSLLMGDDTVAVTVVTSPEAGGKEAREAAVAEKLAAIKASMTQEELQAIVDATAARAETGETDTEGFQAALRSLQAVNVDTLPEEVREYPMTDTTDEKGIRRIWAEASSEGLGVGYLLLDAAGIPQEDLLWYRLYVQLLGSVDTVNYDRTSLANAFSRYLYNYSSNTAYYTPDGVNGHPYLRINFFALNEEMDEAYALLNEVLFNTDYTKVDQVKDRVTALRTALKNSLSQTPLYPAYYTAVSRFSPSMAYVNYTQMIPYYQFLVEAEALIASDPDAVVAKLQGIADMMHRYRGAVSGYCGSKEGMEAHTAAADAFFAGLDDGENAPQTYDFGEVTKAEAIIMDTGNNFNVTAASWEEVGMEEFSADFEVINTLVTDAYLLPRLRDQYGCYSTYATALDDGLMVYSYADPNVGKTYEVYAGIGDFLESAAVDQETLNGYILSAYSSYTASDGELNGAYSAMTDLVNMETAQDTLEYMRQVKSVKSETVASYADAFRKLCQNGGNATAGSASSINAEADIFRNITNPFGAVDATQVAFEDLPEDHPDYAAVRYVYENFLMAPLGETVFGVDQPAAFGEFAGAIYGALGGGADMQADAVAYLAGFGILPADKPLESTMTREELCVYTACLLEAFGVPVETETDIGTCPDAAAVTEGYAPYIAICLDYGMIAPDAEGNLRPQDTATRGEAANVIYITFAE